LPTDKVQLVILNLIAFILCIAVHEFGHAWVANRLGDPTPRLQGRLTLSPLHHIDPFGTLLMPIIGAFTAMPLLAWGRPVQINPVALSRRLSMNTGRMLVAIAGPAMNLLMAIVVSILIVIAARLGASHEFLGLSSVGSSVAAKPSVFRLLVHLNISLMIFNLVPIPPLDGGSVLAWLLPRSMQHVVDFLARYGFLILMVLVLTPGLGGAFGDLIRIPIDGIADVFRGAIQLAVRP
jgi:Zn-dependent protease